MEPLASVESVAAVIQLAVAPVFLLAGIAGLLNVLSTRLGRITDRARVIERRIPLAQREEQRALLNAETAALWERIRLINWSIRLCVTSALVVCLVIIALFLGELLSMPQHLSAVVAVLFVAAMLLIVAGLTYLLREIGIATRRMRKGIELALEGSQDGGS
jgi:type IV secretory pathway VirB6-like protein